MAHIIFYSLTLSLSFFHTLLNKIKQNKASILYWAAKTQPNDLSPRVNEILKGWDRVRHCTVVYTRPLSYHACLKRERGRESGGKRDGWIELLLRARVNKQALDVTIIITWAALMMGRVGCSQWLWLNMWLCLCGSPPRTINSCHNWLYDVFVSLTACVYFCVCLGEDVR